MNNFSQRRIDVATCWATNRIAVLDSLENYEESFAILEEFKEWITNIGNGKGELSHYVMKFPSDINKYINKSIKDLD